MNQPKRPKLRAGKLLHCNSSNEKEREISCRLGALKNPIEWKLKKGLLIRHVRLYQEHNAGWAHQKGSRALYGKFESSEKPETSFPSVLQSEPNGPYKRDENWRAAKSNWALSEGYARGESIVWLLRIISFRKSPER